MFEKSKWIGYASKKPGPVIDVHGKDANDVLSTPSPYIAKSFTLKEKPIKAILNIFGYGDAAYFLNGKRIPDSIRPTYPSIMDKTVIYNTYDVTNELNTGKNRLGAILGSFRVNGSQYGLYNPLTLIVELNIEYSDRSVETIVSDESFKGIDSPILFTGTTYGERYDARLEIPDWCDADFDDSDWDNVILITMPKVNFRTTDCPRKRIISEHKFVEIAPNLFDCGIITAGYARVKITGKSGALIKLNYSERLLPDGKHVDRSGMVKGRYPDMYNSDEYILDGTANKVFEQYMAYHGFRYVEVIGEYDEIELTAVTVHTDFKETAHFECDNDIINKIHFACVNSVLTCCQDVFDDNPKRDAPWIGDTMLSSEVILSEFDSKEVLIENAKQCHDSMNEKGQLPYVVPSIAGWAFSKRFSGPDWGNSVVFHTVWWIYKYYGDLEPFKEFRNDLERSLGFFASMADEDGYIGDGDYATGDWSSLHGLAEARNDIMSNVYYKWDLEIMAELSELCGYDRTEYDSLAKRIKTAFRTRYMSDGKFEEVNTSELITLAARGFFEKDEMPDIVERIVKHFKDDNYLITFGVHGIKMMSELLCEYGYGQLLFDVITNANGLGYAKNAVDGLTALTERFDYSKEGRPEYGAFSLNHHFFCMVDTFFYRRLAGIMVNDFASGDIVVSPLFVKGINKLKAEFCKISVSYDEYEIKISSPYGFKLILSGETKILPAGNYTFSR